MINVIPLGDRVVVQAVNAKSRTAGGVYIPDGAKDKPFEGVVKAIGPLVNCKPFDVEFDKPKLRARDGDDAQRGGFVHAIALPAAEPSEEERAWNERRKIRVGDRVAYSRYSGSTIKVDGADEYHMISARDVLAILEKVEGEDDRKCGIEVFDLKSNDLRPCTLPRNHPGTHDPNASSEGDAAAQRQGSQA